MSENTQSDSIFPYTIRETASFEITIRKSRFRAFLIPCDSKEGAQHTLEQIRKEYWDAAHHCYAYRLGDNGQEYRMSDDGEPSGTAGKPILFSLQRANIVGVILVVVRYFGGVKLGIGPLAKAFTEAANRVIENAVLEEIVPQRRMMVHCSYDDVSRIIELLEEYSAQYEVMYTDAVQFDATVNSLSFDALAFAIIDRTSGRAGYSEITAE